LITLSIILSLALILVLPSVAIADTTVDTASSWDGTTYISQFGKPNTATYGQTITAPTWVTAIKSFSFYLKVPTTVKLRGYIYAWDGTKATGPALWTSATISAPGDDAFHEVTFNPGSVAITPGQQYVLFASISDVYDEISADDKGSWGRNNNPYTGGTFVFLNNGNTSSQWTSTTWSTIAQDLAFKLVFAGDAPAPPDVPEPGSFMLLGSGILALGGVGAFHSRFRKK
jgi:hypothetical protein